MTTYLRSELRGLPRGCGVDETDSSANTHIVMKVAHIEELRAAVIAIE
jgi:hypothetical protein